MHLTQTGATRNRKGTKSKKRGKTKKTGGTGPARGEVEAIDAGPSRREVKRTPPEQPATKGSKTSEVSYEK